MVVIREPKIFILVLILPKSFDKNLKHEIQFITKSNESLAENKAKNKIEQYCPNISIETIFMNTKNSKTNELHKFAVKMSQRLDLRSSNKHFTLRSFISLFITTSSLFITSGKIQEKRIETINLK